MSSEKQDRHVLDELLAQSLVRERGNKHDGVGVADAARAHERRSERTSAVGAGSLGAGGRRSPAATPGEDRTRRWEELPAAEEPFVPEVRAPAPRGTDAALATQPRADAEAPTAPGRLRRRGESEPRPSSSSLDEVQVGRGPLALHLGRGAIEERLGELSARIEELQGRLRRQRERKDELATQARALRQARESAEEARHALEQLRAELVPLRTRTRELQGELESERLRRTRAELELERLRGSLTTLGPLLSGIERATEAVRAADNQAEASPERPSRRQGVSNDARGGETQRAGAGAGAPLEARSGMDQPPTQQSRPGQRQATGEMQGPQMSAPTSASGASAPLRERPQRPPAQHPHAAGGGGIVRVIADAVEHWRGPGPRPLR